jgi:hypothetical protein
MINVGEKIVIGDGNQLDKDVAVIGGEPRARHLYLASDNDSDSARTELALNWRESLGSKAQVFTRSEAISAGLFGDEVSPDAADRIGDVVAIAQGETIFIEKDRVAQEGSMIGHHGGLTNTESYVPLLTTTVN